MYSYVSQFVVSGYKDNPMQTADVMGLIKKSEQIDWNPPEKFAIKQGGII